MRRLEDADRHGGFSLVEILATSVILAVIAVGVARLLSGGLKSQFRSNTTFFADSIRRSLSATVQNDNAWQNTVNDASNSSLACLRNSTSCTDDGAAAGTPLVDRPFRLHDAQNQIVYDPLTASNGFTTSGTLCGDYSTAGNDSCPIRFELLWTAVCSTPCINPQVRVKGILNYSPATVTRTIAINRDNYSFDIIRGLSNANQLPPGFNLQVFSTPGTHNFTVPASVYFLKVEVWGAGAGGYGSMTGAGAPNDGQGSGGAGAYTLCIFNVTPNTTYNVIVGAGGSGCQDGALGCATAGGQSYFNTSNFCYANGGNVGFGVGGEGGTGAGTASQFSIRGGDGEDLWWNKQGQGQGAGVRDDFVQTASGGSSPRGGEGGKIIATKNPNSDFAVKFAGKAPGGGGAAVGGNSLASGPAAGDGAPGAVHVWW